MRKVIAELTVNPYDLTEDARDLLTIIGNVADYIYTFPNSERALLFNHMDNGRGIDLQRLRETARLIEEVARQGKQQ